MPRQTLQVSKPTPAGRGWVEEVSTADHVVKFVAFWRVWVPDPDAPGGKRRERGGSYELGPKVRYGEGLHKLKDAQEEWARVRKSVMGSLSRPTLSPSKVTLRQYIDEVWVPARAGGWRKNTAITFRYHRARLVDKFGDVPLCDLRSGEMQEWLNGLAQQKLSYSVVQHCRSYLMSICSYAFRTNFLPVDEAANLRVPGDVRRPHQPYLTLEAFGAVCEQLPSLRDKLIARLLYFCALRRGEVFGLQRGDFDGERIYVNRQVSDRSAAYGPLKTIPSKAPVAVPSDLQADLKIYCDSTSYLPSDPLFQSNRRTPINSKNWLDRVLIPAAARAKVARIAYHMFRRGYATEAHRLGVDDRSIAAQLRHGDIDVTRRIYIQAVPAAVQAGAEALEKESRKMQEEEHHG